MVTQSKADGKRNAKPHWWFTATHSLGEGKSAAGMWAATAAQLMDLALQNWGTFGIRLQVLHAAVNAHKL